MNGFRRLAAKHRSLAALILVAALLLRILVPTGFMPVAGQGGITIVPCSGVGPQPPTAATMSGMAHHAMAGMSHGEISAHAPAGPARHEGSRAEAPCAFAGLAMPALAGVDSWLLAVALVFLMLLADRMPATANLRAAVRLRPPLRGPPILS